MIQRKAKEDRTKKTNRNAVKVMLKQTTTAKIIKVNMATTVSFEHIIEMTIPNSIYSEQGEKIHKPSLMVPNVNILLIFRISFSNHDLVSGPKTAVKII